MKQAGYLENYFQEEYDILPKITDFGPRNVTRLLRQPDMDDGEYNPYEDDNKV